MGRKRIAAEGELIQSNLFAPVQTTFTKFNPYPKLSNTVEDFRRVLYGSTGTIGLDFEFPTSGPKALHATHIGIATESEAVCVPSTPALIQELVDDLDRKERTFVGHAVLIAERRVIEVATGRKLPLERMDDSMVSFHLMNADLCGNVQKTEDQEEKGSLGFMGLSTTGLMHTMLPAWKTCPGVDCAEIVCPIHRKDNYCAVDAWSSLAAHNDLMEQMQTYGTNHWYYREKIELSEIALEMQEQGIKVDTEYVKRFDAESDLRKEALFPFEMKGKQVIWKVFNPRSSEQVLAYFNENKVRLEGTDKKEVRMALEKYAESFGFEYDTLGEQVQNLPPVLMHLYNLDLFKSEGKGLAPWFADKYLDRQNMLHPRFVTTGTATDRWSSSGPNLTNVPSHGDWGSMVKRSIVPREAGLEIADADAGQLEFRDILYQLGWDSKDVPAKVFEYLVEKSNGGFKQTADFLQQDERQVAKTVVYGSLYGEGISILNPEDLHKPYIKKEIINGSRRVYLKKFGAPWDWTFHGKVVTFTGGNMADRLFRSRDHESRRKALFLTEDVLMKTYDIRKWQKAVSDEVERNGYVRSPYSGKILHLYGSPEDMIKPALSALGQGCGAEHMQGIVLRFKREMGVIPLITVHDSIVLEFPAEWPDKKLHDFFRFMGEETHRLPGFYVPYGLKRGPNYGQLRKVVI